MELGAGAAVRGPGSPSSGHGWGGGDDVSSHRVGAAPPGGPRSCWSGPLGTFGTRRSDPDRGLQVGAPRQGRPAGVKHRGQAWGCSTRAVGGSAPRLWPGAGRGGCCVEDRGPGWCGVSSLGKEQAEPSPLGGRCECREDSGQGGDWTLEWWQRGGRHWAGTQVAPPPCPTFPQPGSGPSTPHRLA